MVKKGMEVKKALFEAVGVRRRPIILTAAATITPLIPTAIGTTIGSHIFQGFAITIIGRLITGMIATLIIVPLLLSNTDKKADIKKANDINYWILKFAWFGDFCKHALSIILNTRF